MGKGALSGSHVDDVCSVDGALFDGASVTRAFAVGDRSLVDCAFADGKAVDGIVVRQIV